jgi:hypothetical protein
MADILSNGKAAEIQDVIIANAGGILNDVSYVWKELVLDSEEISATGGKPKPED